MLSKKEKDEFKRIVKAKRIIKVRRFTFYLNGNSLGESLYLLYI